MTRRSDLMCEDIWECDHKLETAIVENGEIIEWRCRCGRRVPVEAVEASSKNEKSKGEKP